MLYISAREAELIKHYTYCLMQATRWNKQPPLETGISPLVNWRSSSLLSHSDCHVTYLLCLQNKCANVECCLGVMSATRLFPTALAFSAAARVITIAAKSAKIRFNFDLPNSLCWILFNVLFLCLIKFDLVEESKIAPAPAPTNKSGWQSFHFEILCASGFDRDQERQVSSLLQRAQRMMHKK